MAPPYRWFDAFCDAGWARVLSPSALRVILAVGRRVDRHLRTRSTLARLLQESGLPRRTFFDAKAELVASGLLTREKIAGRWHTTLPFPVPPIALEGANPRTPRCEPPHSLVRTTAPTHRHTQGPVRVSADGQQKTNTQLGGKIRGQTGSEGVSWSFPLEAGLKVEGLSGVLLEEVRQAMRECQTAGASSASEISARAHPLSRRLQSQGVLWSEAKVASVLTGG